jgi:hypothetical protein
MFLILGQMTSQFEKTLIIGRFAFNTLIFFKNLPLIRFIGWILFGAPTFNLLNIFWIGGYHKEVPTFENLCARSCDNVSHCNLCGKASLVNIFYRIVFFRKNLWTWLASTLNIVIETSFIDADLNIYVKDFGLLNAKLLLLMLLST